MKDLTKRERILMAIMSLWLFINIVMYFLGKPVHENTEHEYYAKSIFYPFRTDYGYFYLDFHRINAYDFTELLVYGISPIVLFAIYKLFLKTK